MPNRLPSHRPVCESAMRRLADVLHNGALAWGRLVRGRADVVVAAGVGPSIDTVQRWGNPGNHLRSPAVQLLLAIEAVIGDGADPAEALAPLDWVECQLGRVGVAKPGADGVTPAALVTAIARGVRESGEAFAALARRIEDERRPLQGEVDQMRLELDEALRALMALQVLVDGWAAVPAGGVR